jgi:hypothetical protein
MLDTPVPLGSESIKPQGIVFEIGDFEETRLEFDKLRRVDLALEDGVLHALAIIEADLGNAPEPAFTALGRCRDIVGDEKLQGLVGR